jgi:putative tricarboxylic transport membrane protein
MKGLSDRSLGLVGLALCALILWRATLIQDSFIQDPLGPRAFPNMLAIVIGLSSLYMLFRPDEEPHWPPFSKLFEIAMAVACMVAYAQFLPVVGFVIATAVAAAYLAWRLDATPLRAAIAGVGISVGIYVVFHLVLGLSLARGPWGF